MMTICLWLMLLLSVKSLAANGNGTGSGSDSQGTSNLQNKVFPDKQSGTEGDMNQIQNQNKVKTQNQGEGQQLQVATEEKQGQGVSSEIDTLAVVNSVSKKLQMLSTDEPIEGKMSNQINAWISTQNKTQLQIQEHLGSLKSRSGLSKFLFGPNYTSLSEIKKTMERNRLRIEQLEQLKQQLSNEADVSNVQELLNLMQQQNTALQNKVSLEESTTSLFGWVLQLLSTN